MSRRSMGGTTSMEARPRVGVTEDGLLLVRKRLPAARGVHHLTDRRARCLSMLVIMQERSVCRTLYHLMHTVGR
jgi:hypothetical protein